MKTTQGGGCTLHKTMRFSSYAYSNVSCSMSTIRLPKSCQRKYGFTLHEKFFLKCLPVPSYSFIAWLPCIQALCHISQVTSEGFTLPILELASPNPDSILKIHNISSSFAIIIIVGLSAISGLFLLASDMSSMCREMGLRSLHSP